MSASGAPSSGGTGQAGGGYGAQAHHGGGAGSAAGQASSAPSAPAPQSTQNLNQIVSPLHQIPYGDLSISPVSQSSLHEMPYFVSEERASRRPFYPEGWLSKWKIQHSMETSYILQEMAVSQVSLRRSCGLKFQRTRHPLGAWDSDARTVWTRPQSELESGAHLLKELLNERWSHILLGARSFSQVSVMRAQVVNCVARTLGEGCERRTGNAVADRGVSNQVRAASFWQPKERL